MIRLNYLERLTSNEDVHNMPDFRRRCDLQAFLQRTQQYTTTQDKHNLINEIISKTAN